MSTSTPSAPARPLGTPPRPSSSFTSLVAVGVLVVAAGLLMPRLLSLSPVPQDDSPDPTGTPFQAAAPAPKPAAPTPAPLPPTSQPEESTSLFWVAGKVIFGLAIVAGACIALARWSNRLPPTTSPGVLNPVAKLAVDARCVVHLVNAGGRRLLLGTDATGIKVVLELPVR